MASGARGCNRQPHRREGTGLDQFMAILTALGQRRPLVKKTDRLTEGILQANTGLHGLVKEFDLRTVRFDLKRVFPSLKRQHEMNEFVLVTLTQDDRFDDRTGFSDPNDVGFTG